MTRQGPTRRVLADAFDQAHQVRGTIDRLVDELLLPNPPMPDPAHASTIATDLRDLADYDHHRNDRNPHHNALVCWRGDDERNLTVLPADAVQEYRRYWQWQRDHHRDPYGRWWCSKYISMGNRDLLRRGIDPYALDDQTKADDTP